MNFFLAVPMTMPELYVEATHGSTTEWGGAAFYISAILSVSV